MDRSPLGEEQQSPLNVPMEVVSWLKEAFSNCNNYVSAKLTNMPTTYETSLDMALIEYLSSVPSPVVTSSGWTISVSTHFLGGGRHFAEWPGQRRWEVADIGILIMFRQHRELVRSKVALLQSKRLYADEIDWDEDNPVAYMMGFGRLFDDTADWGAVATPRLFTFTDGSRYKALLKGDGQFQAIARYEEARHVPVYYLLYNPMQLPSVRSLPAQAGHDLAEANGVGCRVLPAADLQDAMAGLTDFVAPRFRDLPSPATLPVLAGDGLPGWRLEEFVANLVIQCRAGYIATSRHDAGLDYVFNRRNGPIAAAFQITIDAPEGVQVLA